MSVISRASGGVSAPTLSRPPMSRPSMIQKFPRLPEGMSADTGTGRKRRSAPSR